MNLIFHELAHVTLSIFSAFFINSFYTINDNSLTLLIIISLIGGVLIDTDHLIDYFIAYGWKFDLRKFFKGTEFDVNKKIYVLFHGYEYIAILFVIGMLTQDKNIQAILFTLATSSLLHLVVDIKLNNVYIRTYSIMYRIRHSFHIKKLAPIKKKVRN